jgi:predicted aspartyl protease
MSLQLDRRHLLTGLASLGLLPAAAYAQQRGFAFDANASETGWLPFDLHRGMQVHFTAFSDGRPVRTFLDSGVSGLVLDRAYAERAGMPRGREVSVRTISGKAPAWLSKGKSLQIGNLDLRTSQTAILDLKEVMVASGREFDVMLGRDLFEQLVVDLDFLSGRLAVRNPSRFSSPAGAVRLPLRPDGRLRSVPVAWNDGAPESATFDLGANSALILSPDLVARQRLLEGRRSTTAMSASAEGTHVAREFKLPSVTFGGERFTDVPTLVPGSWAKKDRVATVGMDLLSRFRLIVDYPQDSLFLLPGAETRTRQFQVNRSGIRSRFEGGRVTVVHVSAGSPAQIAGWRAGEEIVAIDGVAVGSPDFGDTQLLWSLRPAGTVVRLGVAGAGERTLKLADYY